MKKIAKTIAAFTFATALVACGGAEKKAESKTMDENSTEETVEVMELMIKPSDSKVVWEGNVVGVYSHTGTVAVTDGMLTIEGNQVKSGNFTADLTTMTPTDENYTPEEGKSKEKLVGHLSSPDFFMVDSFPTASFEVISHDVENNTITGNLTIRGVTREETVNDVKIDLTAKTASGKLTFDRKNYDVAFSHPAKDVVISDDVDLEIMLSM
ncbi:MAG: YceI family protein [Vicingaceae bacterium]